MDISNTASEWVEFNRVHAGGGGGGIVKKMIPKQGCNTRTVYTCLHTIRMENDCCIHNDIKVKLLGIVVIQVFK